MGAGAGTLATGLLVLPVEGYPVTKEVRTVSRVFSILDGSCPILM